MPSLTVEIGGLVRYTGRVLLPAMQTGDSASRSHQFWTGVYGGGGGGGCCCGGAVGDSVPLIVTHK